MDQPSETDRSFELIRERLDHTQSIIRRQHEAIERVTAEKRQLKDELLFCVAERRTLEALTRELRRRLAHRHRLLGKLVCSWVGHRARGPTDPYCRICLTPLAPATAEDDPSNAERQPGHGEVPCVWR